MPSATFENYLIFSGAINLGFTLFSVLAKNNLSNIEEENFYNTIHYASILDRCYSDEYCKDQCTSTNCIHRVSNGVDSIDAQQENISSSIDWITNKTKIVIKNLEKISILLAVVFVLIVGFFQCFDLVESIYNNKCLRYSTLLFLFPFFSMTILLWIITKTSWISIYLVVSFKFLRLGYCRKLQKKIKGLNKKEVEVLHPLSKSNKK